MRNRAAWVAVGLCCMVVAGCGSVSAALAPSANRADSSRRLDGTTVSGSCPRVVRGEGIIALAARGQVKLVDLATCRTRVLADINAVEVRFSVDGRWLAYSRQVGSPGTAYSASAGLFVVSVRGGRVRSPLGRGVVAWSWSPRRDLLYAITAGGSLVSASPTGRRRVITAHLGSRLAAFSAVDISPDGQRAVVDRSRCGPSAVGELDAIDLATGARTVVLRQPKEPLIFAGFSPDGRWLLFWPDEQCSASLAADGMPLQAVRATGGTLVTAVRHMLLFTDYLSWCGRRRLVAASGHDRETQTAGRLVATGAPTWRQRTIAPARTLSWVSPSCASSGRVLAAAAGPDNASVGFGGQHRSIWLLRPNGHLIRQLTSPPASDLSDEAPRFSPDGRWVLFVRTRLVSVGRSDISKDTIELTRADGSSSAIPIAHLTSNDFSYYDHFGWPNEIDWFAEHGRGAAPAKNCPVSALAIHELKLRSGDFGESHAFLLSNVGSRTCTLQGVPRLALTRRGRTVYAPSQTTASHGTTVRLRRGAQASFWVDFLAPHGQPVAGATQLSVAVPGVSGRLELPLLAPDRAAQQLIVSAIVPGAVHQLPRSVHTAPRCLAPGLSLRTRGLDVAAGQAFSVFILRNTASATCSLGGVGRLSIISRSGRPLYSLPQQSSRTPGSTINLHPSDQASFWVDYPNCGIAGQPVRARQNVQAPGITGSLSAPGYYPASWPRDCTVVVSPITGGLFRMAPGFTN